MISSNVSRIRLQEIKAVMFQTVALQSLVKARSFSKLKQVGRPQVKVQETPIRFISKRLIGGWK